LNDLQVLWKTRKHYFVVALHVKKFSLMIAGGKRTCL